MRRRLAVLLVMVVALAGCSSRAIDQPDDEPEVRPTQTSEATPTPEAAPEPVCITVSATWIGHIQYFMEDGYTVTRAAAAQSGDRYTSIATVYTSPAGEEILGSWATGGDPSSETVMQVFPLDDVTGSHTVVMMPNASILAEGSAGIGDATACLG